MSRLTFIVHLPAKAEHYAALEAGVRQVLQDMSHEADFIDCTLHRARDDANTLVVYESWRCTREYFMDQHLPRAYRAAFERALPQYLSAPRRIEFLEDADPPLHIRASA